MKPRAVGYVRVSTDEQVRAYGLDAQEKAIRDYCAAEQLRLGTIYRDEGQSGSNGLDTRTGLAEALAALEAGDAELLVVSRLDRLARDLLVQETVIGRLGRRCCEVRSVAEPDVSSEDPTRVLVRQVLGAIAQYERGVIRGRMMAGKAAKAARGGYTGGRPRYGTRAAAGALAVDVGEDETVARILELRRDGASYRCIALTLEQEGIHPRRGERWQPSTLRAIVLRAS